MGLKADAIRLTVLTFLMYPPFEFNNLLGPLMGLSLLGTALLLVLVLGIQKAFLNDEEQEWRSKK